MYDEIILYNYEQFEMETIFALEQRITSIPPI